MKLTQGAQENCTRAWKKKNNLKITSQSNLLKEKWENNTMLEKNQIKKKNHKTIKWFKKNKKKKKKKKKKSVWKMKI